MYTNEAGRDKEIKRKREIPGFCFPTQMDYKHQTDTVCHLLLLNTGGAQSAKRWRDLETEATRWLPHLVVTDNRCSPLTQEGPRIDWNVYYCNVFLFNTHRPGVHS